MFYSLMLIDRPSISVTVIVDPTGTCKLQHKRIKDLQLH